MMQLPIWDSCYIFYCACAFISTGWEQVTDWLVWFSDVRENKAFARAHLQGPPLLFYAREDVWGVVSYPHPTHQVVRNVCQRVIVGEKQEQSYYDDWPVVY